MKIRTGFVSNSSSSSFLIAVRPGSTGCKIVIEVDLSQYASRQLRTLEDLEEYNRSYYDGDMSEDDFYACRKAIEEGKIVLAGSFSNDSGDPIEAMLCDKGLRGLDLGDDVEVIYNEAGF
jgi:hypothetical protein